MADAKTVLDKYKCKNGNDALILPPVYDGTGEIAGYLRPITVRYKMTMPYCVAKFSQWRRENPSISTGVFEITDERTEKWIDNLVVGNDDRLIFFITDLELKPIGHIGLASFKENECEVDSVLRGEKAAPKGIMSFALKTVIKLAKDEFEAKKIYLKVFQDNTTAVNFYEYNGFIKERLLPMVKIKYDNEDRWEVDESMDIDKAKRKYLVMFYGGDPN